ncbi:hypothetical protein SAMN05216260_11251 [Streptomyces griseoaurantiacus]|uniref:Uncharacterized protein n=1 Tax=Streptomyces griseoaurantiacus TaxID=68213 RepID=A0A1G7Q0B8_9ACTN|nr:hypothetical protein SAMN05216260_11251 [Streptomyces jietaisiensis]
MGEGSGPVHERKPHERKPRTGMKPCATHRHPHSVRREASPRPGGAHPRPTAAPAAAL